MTTADFSGVVSAQYLGCTVFLRQGPIGRGAEVTCAADCNGAACPACGPGRPGEILEVRAYSNSIRARWFGRELLAVPDGFGAERVVLGAGQVGTPQPDVI